MASQANVITVGNEGTVEAGIDNDVNNKATNKQSTDSKGDNTVMWVILGIVLFAGLGGAAYYMTKKRGLFGGESVSVAPPSVSPTQLSSVVASTNVPSRIPSIVSSTLSSF